MANKVRVVWNAFSIPRKDASDWLKAYGAFIMATW